MSDFVKVQLKQIFPFSTPGEWGGEPINGGNARVLRAADFTKDCKLQAGAGVPRQISDFKLPKVTLKSGDLLVEKSGGSPDQPVGRVAYFDKDTREIYAFSNFLQVLRSSTEHDPKFAYYLMTFLYSCGIASRYHQQTTGIINFKLDQYLREIVRVPPTLLVQKRIRSVLESIDRAIEQTEAVIEKYLQIKAGVMQDLFSRGIAKDGKLRPPRSEAPDLYKLTSIGWLPKEWKVSRIADILRSAEYGISSSLDEQQSGVPVLRMNNIKLGRFDVSDMKYSSDPEANRLRLRQNDILYNRTNSMEHVGKAAIWRGELAICSFASYLVRLNVEALSILPDYFCYWINQPNSQGALRRYATPAVQQVNINPTNVKRVKISFPIRLDEQKLIVDRVRCLDSKLDCEVDVLSKLLEQKKGLMHDLLTGKVAVRVEAAEATNV